MIFSAGNIVAQQSIANTGIQSSVPIGKVQLTAALVQAGPHTLCIGRAAVAQIFIVHYSNIDTGHLIPGSSGLAETRIDIGQIVQLQIQLNNCIFRKGGNQIGHSGIKHIPPFLVGLCIAAAGSGAGEGIQHYTPLVGSVPTAGRRLRAEVDNLVGCLGSISNGIKYQHAGPQSLAQLEAEGVGLGIVRQIQGDPVLNAVGTGLAFVSNRIDTQLQLRNCSGGTCKAQVQILTIPGSGQLHGIIDLDIVTVGGLVQSAIKSHSRSVKLCMDILHLLEVSFRSIQDSNIGNHCLVSSRQSLVGLTDLGNHIGIQGIQLAQGCNALHHFQRRLRLGDVQLADSCIHTALVGGC